jgi:PPK2 family polyphosphate:nucleotide phosphotransferase
MRLKTTDIQDFARRFEVRPGTKVDMDKDFDPGDTGGYDKPENAAELLQEGVEFLSAYQDRLYAEGSQALLVVLQALDAAGKDSTIKHVMTGVNPQGCQVTSFKAPSAEELSHDYLWRAVRALPPRGHIGIFNRSYYEEVLVVRVHPEFLTPQRLPARTLGKKLWTQRFREINNFEQHLVENGFPVVKIFLHVSQEEQCRRQLERIDTPDKNWKFNAGDLKERGFWDAYMAAYRDVLSRTSTPWAPWHVVPADHKWFARLAVAAIIADRLIEMDPQYPTIDEAGRQELAGSRESLIGECGGSYAATGKAPETGAQPGGKRKKDKKK